MTVEEANIDWEKLRRELNGLGKQYTRLAVDIPKERPVVFAGDSFQAVVIDRTKENDCE